jgi:hypothetical protein
MAAPTYKLRMLVPPRWPTMVHPPSNPLAEHLDLASRPHSWACMMGSRRNHCRHPGTYYRSRCSWARKRRRRLRANKRNNKGNKEKGRAGMRMHSTLPTSVCVRKATDHRVMHGRRTSTSRLRVKHSHRFGRTRARARLVHRRTIIVPIRNSIARTLGIFDPRDQRIQRHESCQRDQCDW